MGGGWLCNMGRTPETEIVDKINALQGQALAEQATAAAAQVPQDAGIPDSPYIQELKQHLRQKGVPESEIETQVVQIKKAAELMAFTDPALPQTEAALTTAGHPGRGLRVVPELIPRERSTLCKQGWVAHVDLFPIDRSIRNTCHSQ